MSDLICENYALLQVLSRFGISLGFGDKNVREVCELNNVDCNTFLTVVNFLIEDSNRMEEHLEGISVSSLMNYLREAHSYFLDFQLPTIRKKLMDAIGDSKEKEVTYLILRFFDAYVDEVKKHMEHENENVFTYVEKLLRGEHPQGYNISVFASHHVEKLLRGEHPQGYNISVFASHHEHIDTKLTELKNIIIKYFPAGGNNRLLNATLFDIFSCEEDLASHNRVEDFLFVPAIKKLEKEAK